jgi:twitching motility two-component system response regulator PilG
MIEIVLTRSANKRFQYAVLGEGEASPFELAIVDANAPTAGAQLAAARARFPMMIPVFVSDDGRLGEGEYKIVRRMLLSQIGSTLDHAGGRVSQIGQSAAAPQKAAVTPAAQAPVVAQDLGPLRALVVDDSATVRTQIDAALTRIGFKVQQAANADEASAFLLQSTFDLCFLDVVMPGTDGYSFCRNVRANKHTKGLPIIMLTSRSSPFDRARGALAGCDTYLVKPIDLKTFQTAVDRVMMRRFKNDRQSAIARGYKLIPAS